MTRRYNLSHLAGQPMPEDWIHLPDSVVAAADYDALTARLAEAERKIADALAMAGNRWDEWGDRAEQVQAILERTAVSAGLVNDAP